MKTLLFFLLTAGIVSGAIRNVPAQYVTVQAAVLAAQTGDTVLLAPGTYTEEVTTRYAQPGITITGPGATLAGRLTLLQPDWTVNNFKISGWVQWRNGLGLIEIAPNAHRTVIQNIVIDARGTTDTGAILWTSSGISPGPFPPELASDCRVLQCDIRGVRAQVGLNVLGYRNIVSENYCHDFVQADFVRLWGEDNQIVRNTFVRNILPLPTEPVLGWHTDFIQVFMFTNGFASHNNIIGENFISDIVGQILQSEDLTGTFPSSVYGGWIFRNNVFVRTTLGFSITMPNIKFYNNIFYKCTTTTGHVLNLGEGSRGTSDGSEIFNNVFMDCGLIANDSHGWYGDGTVGQTVSYTADYNYVSKNGFLPVRSDTVRSKFRWNEVHGINGGDPKFINAVGDDFKVLVGSPLIGAAVTIPSFSIDKDGLTRPATGWDIGAHQFATGTTPPPAATRYVALTGNDTNPGTAELPWRTVTKAVASVVPGDIVFIHGGQYDEQPKMDIFGQNGNPITFMSTEAPVLKAFRINAPYIILDGLKFRHFTDVGQSSAAAVRIESKAANSKVLNCEFVDLPHVLASDVTFNSVAKTVTSPSSNFIAAGFEVGGKIYLGSSGATVGGTPLWFANHDTSWTITAISPTTLTLSSPTLTFLPDSGTYWAFIRAGTGNVSYPAIQFINLSAGPTLTGVTISGNRVSNWPAAAIILAGNGHLIENNYFTTLKGAPWVQFTGSDHIFRRNVCKDCKNILYYTAAEMLTLIHPSGTGWYDYQVAMMAGLMNPGSHNRVLVEQNWFENIDNQIGGASGGPNTGDITYDRNVFVGVTMHFSGSRNYMKFTNNTFFRCSVGTENAFYPLTLGGRNFVTVQRDSPDTFYVSSDLLSSRRGRVLLGPSQQLLGLNVTNNLFIANGVLHDRRGFYSVSDALSPVLNRNMVAGEEITGWRTKIDFSEVNGINGGDPLFLNPLNPMGDDNLPFTADDGLQVLPASPFAALGGGGCGVYEVDPGAPVAHFRITDPIGWFEPVVTLYDPAWNAQLPTQRTHVARPYQNPPKVGSVPKACTFNASASMNAATYKWDFGDGSATVTTATPTMSHTFTVAGDYTVKMTATSVSGAIHSFYSAYRFTSP